MAVRFLRPSPVCAAKLRFLLLSREYCGHPSPYRYPDRSQPA